jgi:YesN/AraC family two-component response regulator
MMMPSFDGLKLMATLAKLNPQVNIIVMSGLASHAENTLASDPVQAFLSKPFTSQDLLSTIRGCLSKAGYLKEDELAHHPE